MCPAATVVTAALAASITRRLRVPLVRGPWSTQASFVESGDHETPWHQIARTRGEPPADAYSSSLKFYVAADVSSASNSATYAQLGETNESKPLPSVWRALPSAAATTIFPV